MMLPIKVGTGKDRLFRADLNARISALGFTRCGCEATRVFMIEQSPTGRLHVEELSISTYGQKENEQDKEEDN